MRTKDVPSHVADAAGKTGEGISKLLSNKYVLYGGIGLGVLVVGYFVLTNMSGGTSGSASNGGSTDYTTSPVDYGSGASPVTLSGNTGASGDSGALSDAINAANQNSAAQNQEALAAIQQASNVSIANDQTLAFETQLATQATNYAASTNVLDQFIKGNPGMLGVGGSVTPTSAGGVDVGLFSDTNKQPLAFANVLHGVAGQITPALDVSAASQTVNPSNPVKLTGQLIAA